jgi:hypothetical protein
MRKATFIMSTLSFVTSVITLAIIAKGVKKVNDDIQDVRSKTNEKLGQLKSALVNFNI